jgi:hypothetical protein
VLTATKAGAIIVGVELNVKCMAKEKLKSATL